MKQKLADESSYVDDMGESKDSREAIDDLASDADKILGDLSVVVKAWSKTGVKPAANDLLMELVLACSGFQK